MADFLTECISGFCGVCCVAISSAFTQWTYTSRAGANGCCCCSGQTAGCCGCCCDDKFNEDRFEEQVRKDMDKTRDPNAPAAEQPQVTPEMIVPSSSGEPQAQVEGRNEESTAAKQTGEVAKDEKEKIPPPA